MKNAKHCPECANRLLDDSRCRCGWQSPKEKIVDDFRCGYQSGNRRCPLTGVISDNATKGGRWFCRGHW